ncbi:MAG: restriction endonuclease subunit S [Gemmatimonadaceae bacterium]
MQTHRLDAVVDITMGQAPEGESYNLDGEGLPLIAGAGDFGELHPDPKKFTTAPGKTCQPGDIILGIRATIGEKVLADGTYCLGRGVAGLRAQSGLNERYLWHWLSHVTPTLEAKAKGATFKQVNREDIGELRIMLPPLPAQRLIAEILDKADAMRAKRRVALTQLDTLTQSIFLHMFGDPASNPKAWPTIAMKQALTIPLRNGLSPSKSGRVSAKVLTLSAITGRSFDDAACKMSTFHSPPPSDQSVNGSDFLICRGNGNIRLVGRGQFPNRTMPDVTFPDTMIAARVSDQLVQPSFLQLVWNSNAVRQQIESLARTTNGTFKVNQTMLEGVTFMCPPLSLQREFSKKASAVAHTKVTETESAGKLEALFAVLQDRAFRGEL